MNDQNATNSDSAMSEQIIKLLLNTWTNQNKAVTTFFDKYDDKIYWGEVAPGRNRAVYLFGHLIAVHDSMLQLLGFGEKLYPELEAMFLTNPDKSIDGLPSLAELKNYWLTVNLKLNENFLKLQPQQWLERHTKVSEADFALDPKRNKLNILIGRISHQNYHFGQLNFLVQKEVVA